MCIKNSVFSNVWIANGEQGRIIESNEKAVVVIFESAPGQKLTVPCGTESGPLDLAYAATCHKLQGSQAPIVCVVTVGGYKESMVTGNEWLYTALTRGQELCVLFSNHRVLRDLIVRLQAWGRRSHCLDWLAQDKEVVYNGRAERRLDNNPGLSGAGSLAL
jgi:exodeoxyribonuclease V alpha subunit